MTEMYLWSNEELYEILRDPVAFANQSVREAIRYADLGSDTVAVEKCWKNAFQYACNTIETYRTLEDYLLSLEDEEATADEEAEAYIAKMLTA